MFGTKEPRFVDVKERRSVRSRTKASRLWLMAVVAIGLQDLAAKAPAVNVAALPRALVRTPRIDVILDDRGIGGPVTESSACGDKGLVALSNDRLWWISPDGVRGLGQPQGSPIRAIGSYDCTDVWLASEGGVIASLRHPERTLDTGLTAGVTAMSVLSDSITASGYALLEGRQLPALSTATMGPDGFGRPTLSHVLPARDAEAADVTSTREGSWILVGAGNRNTLRGALIRAHLCGPRGFSCHDELEYGGDECCPVHAVDMLRTADRILAVGVGDDDFGFVRTETPWESNSTDLRIAMRESGVWPPHITWEAVDVADESTAYFAGRNGSLGVVFEGRVILSSCKAHDLVGVAGTGNDTAVAVSASGEICRLRLSWPRVHSIMLPTLLRTTKGF